MPRSPSPFQIDFVARSLLSDPLIFIDVGAAGGIDGFFRRFKTGAHARFFGFEPNPVEFGKLANAANTRYFPFAISDQSGEFDFHLHGTTSSMASRPGQQAREIIKVQVRTLAQLADDGTLPGLDAIKVDAEGHDLFALRGIGNRLDRDVLLVKTEFAFGVREPGSQFSRIDLLLTAAGLSLFGMQYNHSPIGEMNSGDAVYLRRVETILAGDASDVVKRNRVLKLICLCYYIRNLDYAYVVCQAAREHGLLTDNETQAIAAALHSYFYLPTFIRPKGWTDRLVQVLCTIQVLLAGQRWRNKSLPKPNRLDRYRFLTWSTPSFLRKSVIRHLDEMHADYRSRIERELTAAENDAAKDDQSAR